MPHRPRHDSNHDSRVRLAEFVHLGTEAGLLQAIALSNFIGQHLDGEGPEHAR